MTCKDYQKKLTLGIQEKDLLAHVEGCLGCRKETKSIQRLNGLLEGFFSPVEPSKDFERVFWRKILERSATKAPADSSFGEQKEPWFVRVLKDIESLVPLPTPSRAAAFLLVAFLIGGTGGVVSAMNVPTSLEAKRTSVQYLSGFHEFKGIPSSSVAATYLKTIESEDSI